MSSILSPIKGWNPIGDLEANNDASLDFTGLTFDKKYALTFEHLVPQNDGTGLITRIGNGSFDATGYTYAGAHVNAGASAWAIIESTSATSVIMSQAIGNLTTEGISGIIFISNLLATAYTTFNFQTAHFDDGGVFYEVIGGGARLSAGSANQIQLKFGGGNVVSGKASLYELTGQS